MAWSDILAAIKFWDSGASPAPWTLSTDASDNIVNFNAGEESQIIGFMQSMYGTSTEAQSTMDRVLLTIGVFRIGITVTVH